MQIEFVRTLFSVNVENVDLDVAAIHRGRELFPIVFLHGFDSTKEDYAGIVCYPAFTGHLFLAYDALGVEKLTARTCRRFLFFFLMKTALGVLERVKFERFYH
ncbi:hypothetical protein BIV60_25350 [Bacillus sp. MUM 116]|uniref:hypothetical protein n=1 Tax=Bacillus sp. MUM 116 TaxID=1678002 RepID=UPI0008F5638D|nr:hypothetical protein [Bacillus sp. MUM 116]OIK08861.1 hypothetical protein BIV60_25350 [Bacillus sp. MUM 116]